VIEFEKVTALAPNSQHRVLTAQVRGATTDDAPADAEEHDEVEVLQPAGLMARPELTETTEAVVVVRGDEPVALLLIDKGAAAQQPEAGEVRLHGVAAASATTVVRIRANGDLEITAASGRDVKVNGGTLKVARVTDPVKVATITATAGPYPVTFSVALHDADGTPGTPSVGTTATLSGVIANSGGAAHFKG
jgi:hypothetical protein